MATEAPVFCSECGQSFSHSEVVTVAGATVCGACKPSLLRRLQEGALQMAPAHYKGFWIRFVAKFLDGILIDILAAPIWILVFLPMMRTLARNPQPDPNQATLLMAGRIGSLVLGELAIIALWLGYNTVMLGKFGTTMGKMAIGAKVVTPSGQAIGWGTAFGRSAMELVSAMILDIGYIIAAFDDRKRALHDRVAGTVVVAK
ncbi:MAG: RDD family protein [Terriglobales bacterium]